MNESTLLNSYRPVTLAEMDTVALTNRIDTKYVIHRSLLPDLLEALSARYFMLEVDGKRTHHYETMYFDKPDFSLYMDHHNQRGNRYKLRLRKYGSSSVSYMELKKKTNTGRTIKSRKKTTEFCQQLSDEQRAYFRQLTGDQTANWNFSSRNCFDRITLVSFDPPERMTLDLDLSFNDQQQAFSFPNLIIAEVKQGSKAPSAFISLMKTLRIQPFSISKYCVGITFLHPELKHNLFKQQQKTLINLQNRA